MIIELGWKFRFPKFFNIAWRGNQMITLSSKYAGMERRIRQRANSENDIRGIPVRIDVIISLRQFN